VSESPNANNVLGQKNFAFAVKPPRLDDLVGSSAQPKIVVKDNNSIKDVKILMPHPPIDFIKIGMTNFHQ
jgi:hypothetical protein